MLTESLFSALVLQCIFKLHCFSGTPLFELLCVLDVAPVGRAADRDSSHSRLSVNHVGAPWLHRLTESHMSVFLLSELLESCLKAAAAFTDQCLEGSPVFLLS